MGNLLNEVFGGIFGLLKYVVPIVPFVWAVYLLSNYKENIMAKIVPIAVLMLCFSAIMTLYQILNNVLEYNVSFSEVVDRAYHLGTTNRGGGQNLGGNRCRRQACDNVVQQDRCLHIRKERRGRPYT